MSGLSELGNTINARIQEVTKYMTSNVPVESGVILSGGGLQLGSLDSVIPKSEYTVLNGTVSDGDKVIVVWAGNEPVIIGVAGGGGGGDLTFLCAVPMDAEEREASTDETGNAIYDNGFLDVIIS